MADAQAAIRDVPLPLDARAALLQSQLDYVQAADEMDAAVGRRRQ